LPIPVTLMTLGSSLSIGAGLSAMRHDNSLPQPSPQRLPCGGLLCHSWLPETMPARFRVATLSLLPLSEVLAEFADYLSAHTCPRCLVGVSPASSLYEHALYPLQTQRSHAPSGVRGLLWAGVAGKLRLACGKRSPRYA